MEQSSSATREPPETPPTHIECGVCKRMVLDYGSPLPPRELPEPASPTPETPLTAYDTDAYRVQQYWRQQAKADTERRGFKEGELQMLWRGYDCFTRKYDTGEIVAAICDALTREGQTAWPGDGISCVEQMIRLQWDRAEKAEAELSALRQQSLSPLQAAELWRVLQLRSIPRNRLLDEAEAKLHALRALSSKGPAK